MSEMLTLREKIIEYLAKKTNRNKHERYIISEDELFEDFQKKGYSEKEIAGTVSWLRKLGTIWWYNGYLHLSWELEKIRG